MPIKKKIVGLLVVVLLILTSKNLLAQGETCATAIDISNETIPFSFSGATCGAGNNYTLSPFNSDLCVPSQANYLEQEEFVLVFTPNETNCFEFSLDAPGNSAIHIFESCPDDPLTAVCIDYDNIFNFPNSPPAEVVGFMEEGMSYYIVISSRDQCIDNFDLEIDLISTGEVNDYCENAIPLQGNGSNYGANDCNEPDEWAPENGNNSIDCPGGQWTSNQNGVWYYFTNEEQQTVDIEIFNIECTNSSLEILQIGVWSNNNTCDLDDETFYGCIVAVGDAVLTLSNLPAGDFYLYADGYSGADCTWNFSSDEIFCNVEAPTPDVFGPYCMDDVLPTILTSSPNLDVNQINWYDNDPNTTGILIGTGNSIDLPNYITNTTGTYQVYLTEFDPLVDGCESIPSIMEITVIETPTASLSGNGTICAGTNDMVELNLNLTGIGPWDVEFDNDGTITSSTFNSSPQVIEVSEGDNLTIVSVNDGCVGEVTNDVNINIVVAPEVIAVDTLCNGTASSYTIQIEIDGGDNPTIDVSSIEGAPGTWNGTIWTSEPITSGNDFDFTLSDDTGCSPSSVAGNFTCFCLSTVGQMDLNPIIECGEGCITATYNPINENFDDNDIQLFFLHTNSDNTLGNIIATNSIPEFCFDATIMNFSDTYYISAVIGNDDGTGMIDLTDICLAVSTGTPIIFYETPTAISSIPSTITCNISTANLNASLSSGNALSYTWTTTDGNIVSGEDSSEAIVDAGGTYLLTVTSADGCTASTDVNVNQDTEVPVAVLNDIEALGCSITSVLLDGTGSSIGNTIDYSWTFNDLPLLDATDIMYEAFDIGTYTLNVYNSVNGCSNSIDVFVQANAAPPIAIINLPSELNCVTTSINLDASSSSTGNNFSYQWTTQDGNIISGENTLSPEVDEEGTYTLTVIDNENGCETIETTFVTNNQNSPQDANIDIQSPSCFGEDNASFVIGSIVGGAPPYLYSIDGNSFTDQTIYANLPSGQYDITIQDIIGCEWSTTIMIPDASELLLNLGEDDSIQLGDSISLFAETTYVVDSIAWQMQPSMSCTDCFNPLVQPTQTTTYSAIVFDANGCEATDEITIIVEKEQLVFIPNTFTPNGDGFNDQFMIYAGTGVQQINSFRVYDRWGETMFSATNFQANDAAYSWDGFFRGKVMNDAVFIYIAEIQFTDGNTKLYKGSIALIRD